MQLESEWSGPYRLPWSLREHTFQIPVGHPHRYLPVMELFADITIGIGIRIQDIPVHKVKLPLARWTCTH